MIFINFYSNELEIQDAPSLGQDRAAGLGHARIYGLEVRSKCTIEVSERWKYVNRSRQMLLKNASPQPGL